MILSGKEIINRVSDGSIIISPFDKDCVNPNSYNYKLGNKLIELDPTISLGEKHIEKNSIEITESGYMLKPGKVYLGSTFEIIGSEHYVTSLIGRSSVGRLGLYLQISADLGNLGPAHRWTLEMVCVQPIIVYPEMKIGQVSFWLPKGKIEIYKGIDYMNNRSID